jgi:CelD/BcsL family acetyltransferase involved in cellulose biosynthesis
MATPFTALVLENTDALDDLEEVWERLWAATRPLPPMLEYRWARTWWQIHGSEGKLLLILVVDGGGEPVGLAPLYLRRDTLDPVRLLRTVHFLGTGEREADEVASEYLGWLGAPEHTDAITTVVGQVLRQRAAAWDRVRLVNVGPGKELAQRLPGELQRVSSEERVTPRPTFRITVRPVEAYLAGLGSSNFRHRCRRALRAGAEAGVELVSANRPEEVRPMFEELARLHQQRWIERGRSGVFDSPVFNDFHKRLVPGYLADGRAWLAGLRMQGRWLALRYHLRTENTVFDYLSGVDTNTESALGPGLLLTLHGLEWCARNGVHTYDLLAGDYEYKRKLATEADEIFEIDVFGSTLAVQLWLAARKLKSRLRTATQSMPAPEPTR